MRKLLFIVAILFLTNLGYGWTRNQISSTIRQYMSYEGVTINPPDSTIWIMLDLSILDVSLACSCNVDTDFVTTVAGTQKYPIGDTGHWNFGYIKSVQDPKKRMVPQIEGEHLGRMSARAGTDSIASYFAILTARTTDSFTFIAFDTIPAKAGQTYQIAYYAKGKRLYKHGAITADSTSDLTSDWEDAVAQLTVSKLYARDQEWTASAFYKTQALQDLARTKANKFHPVDRTIQKPKLLTQ